MIHFIQGYTKDKHYGQLLNDEIARLPDGDYVCITDLDTMFLTPNAPDLMYEAIEDHPECQLFSCMTNRAYGQPMVEVLDIKWHIDRAKEYQDRENKYRHISGIVPSFFWLFPKTTWLQIPFDEHPIIHGRQSFDARWSRRIRSKIRIERLYVFHLYRMDKDRADHSHLL